MVTITGVHPPARFGELHEKMKKWFLSKKSRSFRGLINGGS